MLAQPPLTSLLYFLLCNLLDVFISQKWIGISQPPKTQIHLDQILLLSSVEAQTSQDFCTDLGSLHYYYHLWLRCLVSQLLILGFAFGSLSLEEVFLLSTEDGPFSSQTVFSTRQMHICGCAWYAVVLSLMDWGVKGGRETVLPQSRWYTALAQVAGMRWCYVTRDTFHSEIEPTGKKEKSQG